MKTANLRIESNPAGENGRIRHADREARIPAAIDRHPGTSEV